MNKNILENQTLNPFAHSFCLLPDNLWQDCQKAQVDKSFSSVINIPPWFSMFMYHLWDKQLAHLVATVQRQSHPIDMIISL
jgi:hypothetical protein